MDSPTIRQRSIRPAEDKICDMHIRTTHGALLDIVSTNVHYVGYVPMVKLGYLNRIKKQSSKGYQ